MRIHIGHIVTLIIIVCLLFSCMEEKSVKFVDLQGHRGCRGLMPENSIEGFIHAIKLGVHTLEMDVVISEDKKVLLSHEPFLSHEICYDSTGAEIDEEVERGYNLYQMTYEQIKKFDCGTKPHPRFPDQQKFPVYKPLLVDVIDTIEKYIAANSLEPIHYNIETKSIMKGDRLFHPPPDEFIDLLVREMKRKQIVRRTTIQSFDIRTLQSARKKYPDIKLVLLIAESLKFRKNIEKLGFIPEVYSPNFFLVNDSLIEYAEEVGMKVIPWTVNDKGAMIELIEMGVDGIITDYPDRALEIFRVRKINQQLDQL